MHVEVTSPDYVLSPNALLWDQRDAGDALVWSDTEETAAMAQQMAVICTAIFRRHDGLPPLSSLLFVVDALCKPWSRAVADSRLAELMRPLRLRRPRACDEQAAAQIAE